MCYDYLILGAGPAGLTVANKLKFAGCTSFLVLEKEREAGGLCRSVDVEGAPLDIGGGHFLDVRRPEVNNFLFQFMPEAEWNLFSRNSQIDLKGKMIGHPLEANIWQLPIEEQVTYLKSIACAGCNMGEKMPSKFKAWIRWKLGEKISEDYMIPYNSKMFGSQLDNLGTYWLEKLPSVSFEETLYSCLEKKPFGLQPGHAQFYYPKKYGYGELWKRMADNIASNIIFDSGIVEININECSVKTSKGQVFKGKKIITTIPWMSMDTLEGMPEELIESVRKLQHTGVLVEYQPGNLNTEAHWVYYPNPMLKYHRILVRHNFCSDSKGYWTETNADRDDYEPQKRKQFYSEYAYPLNTVDKPEIMERLLEYCRSKNVYGLGRWGEHEHYNSDLTVAKAMELVKEIL